MKISKFSHGYVAQSGNPTFLHHATVTKAELDVLVASDAYFGHIDPEKKRDDVAKESAKLKPEDTLEIAVWLNEEEATGTELRLTRNGGKIYAVKPLHSAKVQNQIDKILALSAVLDSNKKVNSRLLAAFGIE